MTKEISWAQLPAAFIKNVQSSAYIDRYPEIKNTKYKNGNFQRYFNEHSIKNSNDEYSTNVRIQNRLTKMREKVLTFYDRLNEGDVQKIIRQDPTRQFLNERRGRFFPRPIKTQETVRKLLSCPQPPESTSLYFKKE